MTAVPIPPAVRPWYRQRWPWFLIAGPAIVVAASFVTLMLAAATDDGVIADDYYKRGLLVNRESDRLARAQSMHLGAVLRVTEDGAATLVLGGVAEPAALPPVVQIRVAHPTRAGQDRVVVLTRGPGDVYVGAIAPRSEGRWRVSVETDAWKLPTVAVVDGLRDVRIGAAPPAE
jgi:hypothetical protein